MRIIAIVLLAASALGCGYFGTAQAKTDGTKTIEERVTALEAKLALAELKPPSKHYQIHKDGGRTWRFDPSTGNVCILLASDADWRNPKTQSSSCTCKDFLDRTPNPSDTAFKIMCGDS